MPTTTISRRRFLATAAAAAAPLAPRPARGETASQARDAAAEFAITPGVETVADSPGVSLPAGDIEQQRRKVHAEPMSMRPRDP